MYVQSGLKAAVDLDETKNQQTSGHLSELSWTQKYLTLLSPNPGRIITPT